MCLLLAVAAPSPAQEEDTVPPPEVFRGKASSQLISVQVDRDAFLPVPELFRFIALDGAGIFESSNRQARSSLFFPGNGFILGPSLLCGTFGAQFPSEFKPIMDTCLQYKYPLTVFADDFEPDGATSGALAFGAPGDAVSGNAVGATAHAGEKAVTTDAAMQDLRVLGVPPFGPITPQFPGVEMDTSLVTVGSAVSRTNQRIVKGSLIAEAEATLSDVRLIGGLIRIGSLRSTSVVTDDAKGKRTSQPTLLMSGITVGGQPAQITKDGLQIGSADSGPLDQQMQSALNEVLRSFDVNVTILDSEQDTAKNGAAVATVGGLLIEFSRDVQGLPNIPGPLGELDPNGLYTGSIQLGTTGVLGSAVNFGLDDIDSDFGGDVPFSNDGDIGGGTFDFDPGSPGYEVPGSAGVDRVATPSSPSASAGTSEVGELARSIGGIFGDRLGMLYLALMFAVLSLCIAPVLTVPARFGGRST
ncbi:MAG TPA: choice-of-anchor P family protein [Acidimicrobiales bacterium]|nr:choice-of-anchor P family protein [Acidimicrobiales bacterium]